MKGSCLCGAIEYEAVKLSTPILLCHCKLCQKAHAAPFTPTSGVLRDDFRWLKGSDKLSSYESSPGKLRHFCSLCGTHLVAEKVGHPYFILRIATLNDDPGTKPAAHIWTAHDEHWLEHKDIPEYEEWQPGRN